MHPPFKRTGTFVQKEMDKIGGMLWVESKEEKSMNKKSGKLSQKVSTNKKRPEFPPAPGSSAMTAFFYFSTSTAIFFGVYFSFKGAVISSTPS